MKEILEKLEFTPGEIKVYLSLLKLGNTTTGPLVDDSNVSKSKVYEILERLVRKGIVSQITQEGIKHFQAANPKRLLEIYEEKETQMNKLKTELLESLPILEKQFESKADSQEASILKGTKGLKTTFNEILSSLNKGDEYIVFCAVEPPAEFKPFLTEFTKQRIKKGATQKIIFSKKVKESYLDKYKKNKLTQVKTIPPEFNTPAVFNLYSNKTAIILWSKDPIAIIIENKQVTDSFKQYFNIIWKISK